MAEVTIELRHLLDMDNFSLFDFDYECDDLNFKTRLEQAIIDRFYFDEIGLETADRFLHEFRTTMQRIMPYYNKLHNTTLFDGDPMTTYKLKEITERANTGTQDISEANTGTQNISEANTGTQTVSGTDSEDIKSSDYPQHLNPSNDILSGQSQRENDTEQTRTDNLNHSQNRVDNLNHTHNRLDNLKEEQEKIIEGYSNISYSELLEKHRSTILRIISMIINELKPLFIMIY